jgi:hypothetical protein
MNTNMWTRRLDRTIVPHPDGVHKRKKKVGTQDRVEPHGSTSDGTLDLIDREWAVPCAHVHACTKSFSRCVHPDLTYASDSAAA